jgi:3-mercaptopyruvate sulfurtransferase SseA
MRRFWHRLLKCRARLPTSPVTTILDPETTSAAPAWRDDLPRGRQLVTARWLHDLVSGRTTLDTKTGAWCLFEVDFGAPVSFTHGHIPGAAYLDTSRLEHGPLWNKVPDAELLRVLLDIGVRHDSTVILYGRNTTAAARAAHLMLYAGVPDVRLLDGGMAAWQRADLLLAAGAPQVHAPAEEFGAIFPVCPQYLVHTAEVRALLHRPATVLASIRTWDEFVGKTSGYRYIDARGEIAGALWGRAGDPGDVNSMSAHQNPDGTMKPAREIARFWRQAGIHAEWPTVFYCGTGWRASLAFFYAWLMGWDEISVYDGGWFEWSSDPLNPRQ